jgi:diacylglycerol kinase (ATP)
MKTETEIVKTALKLSPCPIFMNPKAGAFRKNKATPEQVKEFAREVGLEIEIIQTESQEDLQARIRRLVSDKAPRLAIAGGDGTVHLAAQEMAGAQTALGIIPQGTANNFATALHLPREDIRAALKIIHDGFIQATDLGETCGEYFTEAAGVGLFADALAYYGKGTNKNIFRGFYALLNVFRHFGSRRIKLILDGKVHTERAVMCTAANTYRIAEAMPVAPDAKVDDGLLDIIIVGDLSRWEVIKYYRAVKRQQHLQLPKVTTLRARQIRIEADRAMHVHCDDMVVGETPVTMSLHPRALRVLVSR